MSKGITWVGIDDHKLRLTVAVLKGSRRQEPGTQSVENEDRSLRRWVRKLAQEANGGEIRMCYEAGPNGFALKRRLEAMGPVVVEVVAPTPTPRRVRTASHRTCGYDPSDAAVGGHALIRCRNATILPR
jgi:hypothetical protein